jgi:hypothetical protein
MVNLIFKHCHNKPNKKDKKRTIPRTSQKTAAAMIISRKVQKRERLSHMLSMKEDKQRKLVKEREKNLKPFVHHYHMKRCSEPFSTT